MTQEKCEGGAVPRRRCPSSRRRRSRRWPPIRLVRTVEL